MEATLIPNFLKDGPARTLFRYVDVFANLSVALAYHLGRDDDPSVRIMRTIQRLPRLQETPVLSGLFNLLTDVIFDIQSNQFSDSTLTLSPVSSGYTSHLSDTCVLTQIETNREFGQKLVKIKMFPETVLERLLTGLRELQANVHEHRRTVMELKKAQKVFLRKHNKLMKYHGKQEVTSPAVVKTSCRPNFGCIRWPKRKKKSSDTAPMERLTEKANEAYARLVTMVPVESQTRERGVGNISGTLQSYIEGQLCYVLSQSVSHLISIESTTYLSQELLERLNQFDHTDMAAKIYKSLSTKYMAPLMEDFTFSVEVPEPYLLSPDLNFQDRHGNQYGPSSSFVCLLDETARAEPRVKSEYVLGKNDNVLKRFKAHLTFRQGQRIKQKICSSDGTVAFGWTKRFAGMAGAPKQYGFYETRNIERQA